jgi:hypothetical protein
LDGCIAGCHSAKLVDLVVDKTGTTGLFFSINPRWLADLA